MPLEVGHLRTANKDILSCPCSRLLFLYLKLHDIGRVLDDLGNVGDMARSDLSQNALPNPDDTAGNPVALISKYHQSHSLTRKELLHTQNTPICFQEQKGGLSGLIMHHMPCSCQAMKKGMNR